MEIEASPVFDKIHTSFSKGIKIYVHRWGTRSSKTRSILQNLVLWLITGKLWELDIPDGVCHIVRKYKATLRVSVQRDFDDIISQYDLWRFIESNKTEKTYKCGARMIEFMWADDQQKIRGTKRRILYCNEANELDYSNEFFQLLVRTKDLVLIDFNPDDEDIWINKEIEQNRKLTMKDVSVTVSTYKDNPFLSQEEIAEIEHIKDVDPYLWQVYGLGEYGKRQGLVFDFEVIEELPDEAKYLWEGLDFGYSNDPTALIGLYQWNAGIIWDERIYQTWLTNDDIAVKFSELEIRKWHDEIIADSAEPKSIEELYRKGYNVKPAVKWPDSINYGISVIKQYKLYVTARSINLIKELRKYKWLEDKHWKITNKPIDMRNHAIDAGRYITVHKLWKPNTDRSDFWFYTKGGW